MTNLKQVFCSRLTYLATIHSSEDKHQLQVDLSKQHFLSATALNIPTFMITRLRRTK